MTQTVKLYGPPGTGKTTAPMKDANIPLEPYATERGRERHTKGGPASE